MRGIMILGLMIMTVPALAHHPGERLDEVMVEKEPAFELTDLRSMPDLEMANEQGAMLTLRDLRDTIVVLSIVPPDCGAPCTEQQDILASVQKQVNITPMKQMVTFLTIYDRGASVGASWDHANWLSAAPLNETVTESARRLTAVSDRNPSTPLIHIIDRGSRHAGLFHGTGFHEINLILYINGLTNAPVNVHKSEPDTWWNNLLGLFK